MDFDYKNLKTTVNAETIKIGRFGYFDNDLASIKKAVATGKTNLHVVYARLNYVLEDKFERRFGCDVGNFSLFYCTDREHNQNRY